MMLFFFAGFIVTVLLTYPLILFLKKLNGFQIAREEGPETHKKKSGTPTMGGIGFVLVVTILSFAVLPRDYFSLILLFLGYAFIGFIDDLLKILRKHNQGLTFWQKIISQVLVSALFLFAMKASPLYFLFCLFVIVGAANASNLTDGLDGLLAGSGSITFICFGIILLLQQQFESSSFALLVAGGLLGFIIYNLPIRGGAKLFMGDVGSLPIGAALAGLAIVTANLFVLVIISGLFIVEALSVIIQVTVYKLFRKRVFKIAPLHHHFEILGWSENKVVLVFWQVSLILGLIGIAVSAASL